MDSTERVIDYDQGSFPEALYLAAFPDVALAVQQGVLVSGFEHYARFGRAEIGAGVRPSPFPARTGRAATPDPAPPPRPRRPRPPRPPAASPEDRLDEARFLEALYLAANPDVAELVAGGEYASGLDHWLELGRGEERQGLRPSLPTDAFYADAVPPLPAGADELAGFDAAGYLDLYPDVRRATDGSAEAAAAHWRGHGRAEGRAAPGAAPYAGWRVRLAAMLDRPFGIDVYGPFAAASGLGTAARGLVRAIAAAGIPFTLHAFDVSRGAPRVLARDRAVPGRHRVTLLLANADQLASLVALYLPGQFDDAYTIAVWAWELAAFRPDWFGAFAPLDEVWVNSAFEHDAIAPVSPVPVHVVPLPVQVTPHPQEAARDAFGIPRGRLVVLVAFDVGSTLARKNPQAAIAAYREATAGTGGRAFLVVKLHSGEGDPSAARALATSLRGMDDVLVIAERLPAHRMALLQSACDCLLSAHRSEGFGLNLAEMMALGRAVVATGYSGPCDFLDAAVGYPVEHRLVEVAREAGPYRPGYVWAEPVQESLVAQLRAVLADPAEARARGARAQARMETGFSPAAVGAAILARLRGIGLEAEVPPFLRWIGTARALVTPSPLAGLAPEARAAVEALDSRPVLSLVVPVFDVAVPLLQACVDSVLAQTYPHWELCLCDDASTDPGLRAALDALRGRDPRIRVRRLAENRGIAGASNAAAEMATGAFVLMFDDDDTLAPDALLEVARAIDADPEVDALYSDEDKIDERGAYCDHYHKPDWSPEHLESVMYTLHVLGVRKSLFLALGGFRDAFSGAQDYDLMLRVSRATERIHHIPRVLYHWRKIPGSAASVVDAKPYALDAGMRALAEHATAKYGPGARVEPGLLPGTFRLRRPVAGSPRVTLVVLTGNVEAELPGRGRVRLVDVLVQSILARTDYPNHEILVVDNATLLPAQLARFRAAGVRVADYPGPVRPFNYAAKANFALSQVRTEHLVLLNDDMEVIGAGWLTALMELLVDPGIGAVGGRLLHGDGTVQHVGMVLGVNGAAAHPYHSAPAGLVGYNGFTHVIRNYAAVTGACLATRRSVLTRVGGFDEGFAVDFNDTDLCLRMVEAGFRVAYTPYCELYHLEGRSAPRAAPAAAEVRRFVARWRRYVEADPYYNVNLSRTHADFRLRDGPPLLAGGGRPAP